jgi:hypothetical protein
MTLIVCLLAICGNVRRGEATQHADRFEVNTLVKVCPDGSESIVFRQLIVWHWHHECAEYHVQEWFELTGENEPVRAGIHWVFRYRGAHDKKLHDVSSDCLIKTKTTTDCDPERYDKRYGMVEELRHRLIGQVRTSEPPAVSIVDDYRVIVLECP